MSKPTQPNAMSLIAKTTVLSQLRVPEIQKLNFDLSVFRIRPRLYEIVHDAIVNKKIRVIYEADTPELAFYDPDTKEIILGYAAAPQQDQQALIVHECTHAGFDLLNYETDTVTHEAVAYVAAFMFIIAQDHKAGKMNPSDARVDPNSVDPFQFALASVALTLYLGRGSDIELRARLAELEREIAAHRQYKPEVEKERARMRHPSAGTANSGAGSAAFQSIKKSATAGKGGTRLQGIRNVRKLPKLKYM